jgi:catechol 2,3-dioxygenase-like lactoylglutathione lyase family enzyme
MAVETLEHYTIRCRDLEATRAFYDSVLGLKSGPRPEFSFPGYWIYCGGVPTVHLVEAREETGEPSGRHATGPIDHIAFRGSDLERMREHFSNLGLEYEERSVPGGRLHQLFLHDPDGIRIELNFRS